MSDPTPIRLLIVDDEHEFRGMMSRWFSDAGFEVTEAADGERAFALASEKSFDVAILDLMMPGIDGVTVLKRFKASGASVEVILLTGKASVPSAVDAMKSGAFDYLVKPIPLRELEAVVRRANDRGQLARENQRLRSLLNQSSYLDDMIGQSPPMKAVFRLIERSGPSDSIVLITGESGVGKETAARAIHKTSNRCDKPFVVLNCAVIAESMMELELFGSTEHEATAEYIHRGLLETANHGSLYIDDVADLPLAVQSKLLQVLESGVIRREGSTQELNVDIRIIAASTKDLASEVQAGRFREDLYYRLNVMSVELPPLRERTGDIALLVAHLMGANWRIEPDALEVLAAYPWPGNVRQLGNVIERAKILSEGQTIRSDDLPDDIRSRNFAAEEDVVDNLATIERAKVVEVLRRMSGNKTHAARKLGIDRRKLYRLVEKYHIDNEEFSPAARSN